MASIIVSNRDRSPLTRDQIAAQAPTVLAECPHDSRSQRYLYVSTLSILDALDAEGFVPTEIRVTRTRDESKRGYAKHQIRLAHRNDIEKWATAMAAYRQGYGQRHAIGAPGDDFIRPEVSLVNSHDGSSAVKGSAAMMKLRCFNGLTVAEGEFTSFGARHSAKYRDEIVEGVYRVLEETTGPVMAQVEQLARHTFDQPERLLLAAHAESLRFPNGSPVPTARLLSPKRQADAPPTAWNTLNVLQENTIRGGLRYEQRSPEGKLIARRETRPVTGIDDLDRINRGIWGAVATLAASDAATMARNVLANLTPEARAALLASL